ncbi:MAG: hypothetical protein EWV50_09640 [Microcystis aeruginosa Ma_MB_F_20061100_S20]|nr:MAG: hypothetical protein EWV50_09640 [Microcystis aeruginosa Ma_MB_F_20061100_S20]
MKILLLGIDGKLGDAVINSTFAKYAIEIDKEIDLHMIASGAAFEYWKLLEITNKIYYFDRPGIFNLLKIAQKIRNEKYDYIVAFRSKFKNEKTKFLLWAAKPRSPIIYSDDDSPKNSQHVIYKSFAALEKIYGVDTSNKERRYFHPPIAFPYAPTAPYCILNFFGADNNPNRSFNEIEAFN